MLMKLLLVTECGDPYEPSQTVAIVNSIQEAKDLGFAELWEYTGRLKKPILNRDGTVFMEDVEYSVYKDHVTGTIYESHDGAHYPQPLVEWVETHKVLTESEFAKGKVWFCSPNKANKPVA